MPRSAGELVSVLNDAGNAVSYLREYVNQVREGRPTRRVLLLDAGERLAEVVQAIKGELAWEKAQTQ